ncbi:DUF4224 domain-containing protein [Vogesella sp. LIG4]|uniref:DUF4224 domain-containing protein n=1 Tax=Vogesella sp. LIG4 TaxID=1192162 RepID=UPI00081F7F78|nr:DUF4224 domain-containing protein [Vogesella sp. LIG4]SCK29292.1 protein of unknown function [Vogesella sp. LIG4]
MTDINDALFLTADEVATLTGRKLKSKQVEALRMMGVPFRVNACGRPVVTRSAVEGSAKKEVAAKPKWQPAI